MPVTGKVSNAKTCQTTFKVLKRPMKTPKNKWMGKCIGIGQYI
jgi:hypothetical protein